MVLKIALYLQERNLTPSEIDLCLLTLKGFTRKEIAKLRITSEAAVKSLVTCAYKKLNIKTRHEMLVLVVQYLYPEIANLQYEPKSVNQILKDYRKSRLPKGLYG